MKALILITALGLAGCGSVGSDFQPPAPKWPRSPRASTTRAGCRCCLMAMCWWRNPTHRPNPTLEELAQLDFIEACAHETIRLKPVAPIIGLQALRDTTVGNVRLPAGGVIINVMRSDSVSDGHLPRAAAFEPGRWLADGTPGTPAQAANAAKRVSMPFGAGPRICPGRYLALLEMKMAMVALLGHFDIQGVDTPQSLPAVEKLSFTMMPVGLTLRLREQHLQ